MLELQPAFAGSVGHRFHAAVISVSCSIEHDAGEPSVLRPLRDELPHFRRLLALLPGQLVIRYGRERTVRRVVDQLRVDVLERAKHHETRTLRGPRHALAHAQMAAIAQLLPTLRPANLAHLLASRLTRLPADLLAL